jgi:hypothetical protein
VAVALVEEVLDPMVLVLLVHPDKAVLVELADSLPVLLVVNLPVVVAVVLEV